QPSPWRKSLLRTVSTIDSNSPGTDSSSYRIYKRRFTLLSNMKMTYRTTQVYQNTHGPKILADNLFRVQE
ncbi:hypothetical protein PspLS_10467, partial [Pyricularia sp. CBS 133598]